MEWKIKQIGLALALSLTSVCCWRSSPIEKPEASSKKATAGEEKAYLNSIQMARESHDITIRSSGVFSTDDCQWDMLDTLFSTIDGNPLPMKQKVTISSEIPIKFDGEEIPFGRLHDWMDLGMTNCYQGKRYAVICGPIRAATGYAVDYYRWMVIDTETKNGFHFYSMSSNPMTVFLRGDSLFCVVVKRHWIPEFGFDTISSNCDVYLNYDQEGRLVCVDSIKCGY